MHKPTNRGQYSLHVHLFPSALPSADSYVKFAIHCRRLRSMIVSSILSRLDYGNVVLVGLPAYIFRRFQSVMNADSQLVYKLRASDRITDTLASPTPRLGLRTECIVR